MSMDLRIVVVGGGHVGFHTAVHLDRRGHDVVIVEQDPHRCEFLNDRYVATVIEGDATRPSVLKQTQPERSDVVASMIGDSAMTNVGICMTVRRMAPGVRTIARIDHGEEEEYTDLVDAVVFPEQLAAHAAANEVIEVSGGGVRTIEEVNEQVELLEVEVTEEAPAAGKTLERVSFPRGAVVVAAKHGDEAVGPDTVLEPGSQYILATRTDVTDEVLRILRG